MVGKKKKRNPLNLNHQTRPRREYIDYDYVDQLSPEDKEWLGKFTDEYYGGAVKKGSKKDIHYSENEEEYKKFRKDCYDRNNRINRCLYGLAKLSAKIENEKLDLVPGSEHHEEIINDLLDEKRRLEELLSVIPTDQSSDESGEGNDNT